MGGMAYLSMWGNIVHIMQALRFVVYLHSEEWWHTV